MISLDGQRNEMPTAVFFASETQQVLFGSEAMQAYLEGADGRLLRSLKSLLGSPLMDEYTQVNGQAMRFFDIVVLFLRELKRRCELQLGCPIHRAVVGRPVHFVDDNTTRDQLAQATLLRAAREAGFEHIDFQQEPIAAALDFEQRLDKETTALIVDIGGGTSDFSVIRLNRQRSHVRDRHADILATTGVHIGGTDFDRLLDLSTVMPLLGYKHIGTGGRPVPNSIFFDLSTWHLIHQTTTRKAMHFARELWTDYADQSLHRRLVQVLEDGHGHRILSSVERAKIDCSISRTPATVSLDFFDAALSPSLTPAVLQQALHNALSQVVQCALQCIQLSALPSVDVVYLTGGSSALQPLMDALRAALPSAQLVEGNRFGGVAAGLAYCAATTS